MITKEQLEQMIEEARIRRDMCAPYSSPWNFFEGQVAAYSNIYIFMD